MIDYLFARRRITESGCWEWTLSLTADGYGRGKIAGKKHSIHRLAWRLLRGPIPAGLQIDHLCRNRACFNPDHLEPVTCRENLHRGDTWNARNAARTTCLEGHPFDAVEITKTGPKRRCKTCVRARERRNYAKKKVTL